MRRARNSAGCQSNSLLMDEAAFSRNWSSTLNRQGLGGRASHWQALDRPGGHRRLTTFEAALARSQTARLRCTKYAESRAIPLRSTEQAPLARDC